RGRRRSGHADRLTTSLAGHSSPCVSLVDRVRLPTAPTLHGDAHSSLSLESGLAPLVRDGGRFWHLRQDGTRLPPRESPGNPAMTVTVDCRLVPIWTCDHR